jgi:hypothetical protein
MDCPKRKLTDGCCPSIYAILDELFDGRTQVDYDLPGLDSMHLHLFQEGEEVQDVSL